jgi:micrococcal nuclease
MQLPVALVSALVRQTLVSLASIAVLTSPLAEPTSAASYILDHVKRVVDGDTIITETTGTIRLIGMNTPETVGPAQRQGAPAQCFGQEASAATKGLLPVGSSVRLESDVEERDKYGRRLAYVFREPDDTFINGVLVQNGFARARSYKPNTRYDALFKDYQKEAQRSKSGLWGACEPATVKSPALIVSPSTPRLANPGDTRNCGDFSSYAEAKAWFDTYFSLFGDVAKLDGDGDGIPCESLLKGKQRS